MPTGTRTKVRPQTTSNVERLKSRPSSSTSLPPRRLIKSARARLKTREDSPPDLNPPEYSPLLCELNIDPVQNVRPDSGYETQDGGAWAQSPTGSDDEADDISTPYDASSTFSIKPEPYEPEPGQWNDYHSRPVPTSPPKLPTERPKTTEQLKTFLAAAMDSVRFFLVTSSIGQANKDGVEGEDSESDSDDEPPQPEYNRSKLLIMSGALMDPPWRFSIETYRYDPEMLEFYTGFKKYDLIKSVFNLIRPNTDTIQIWSENDSPEHIRDGAFKMGIITQFEEFFLFLYKLRHNPSATDLAIRFSMSEKQVQLILDDWLHYLYGSFGQKPVWPTRDNVDVYMQRCFKSVCPCARMIVHVANMKVRMPRDLPIIDNSKHESESEQEAEADEQLDSMPEEPPSDNKDSKPVQTPETQSSVEKRQPRRFSVIRENLGKFPAANVERMSDKKKAKPQQKVGSAKKATIPEADKSVSKASESVQADKDDVKHYKSVVVFQPTGAACMVSKLYPPSTPSEVIITDMGVLELLDECDDVVTVDSADDLRHDVMEELLHPYAANYMNLNFLQGCMPIEEFRRKSPMNAHRVKCMRWHIYQSIEWVRTMKIWDDLAELPKTWVDNIERVWTISYLLTNFLPSDPCLDVDAS